MQVAAVFVAFVLGGILAIVVDRAVGDSGPMRAQETIAQAPIGTLETVPGAPLRIFAERVRLPSGFRSTRYHGGPTFSFVDFGRIQVEVDGQTATYGPGAFFFVPAGQLHTVRVVETTQLAILRMIPPGEDATTEVR
jgi:mannose-6-phosphate isomerase-like protein (cupin superfamily)